MSVEKVSNRLLILSLSVSFCVCFLPEGKASDAVEKAILLANTAFEQGNYQKAERYLKKAQIQLSKTASGTDERLPAVLQQLGESSMKQGKYEEAENAYKQALDLLKQQSGDLGVLESKLNELHEVYRRIDIASMGKDANLVAEQFGTKGATATRFKAASEKHAGGSGSGAASSSSQDPSGKTAGSEAGTAAQQGDKDEVHHIDISLQRKFQQGIKELVASIYPEGKNKDLSANQNSTGAASQTPAPEKAESKGEPKRLRLDKKITFDLSKADDGSLMLSNIQGIFVDVGLWVKLKALLMPKDESDTPGVEVTAGAFGVEKKVRTNISRSLFDQIKDGFQKFDPFLAAPALAGERKENETQKQTTPAENPQPQAGQ